MPDKRLYLVCCWGPAASHFPGWICCESLVGWHFLQIQTFQKQSDLGLRCLYAFFYTFAVDTQKCTKI